MNTVSFRLFFVVLLFGVNNAQLSSSTFYDSSCPGLLANIKAAVNSAVATESRMGASLLRLHFHDCFVNGCDASNLLDDTANFTGEKNAGANANSARGFEVIDTIKTGVESLCPGVVSCADILAVAARDGVVALGGPNWQVSLGRKDATTTSQSATSSIPAPTSSLSALITAFTNQGLTATDMVTLSGAHTIGQARCAAFSARLNEGNIDPSFLTTLQGRCSNANNLSPLDSSPTSFNNDYYTNLISLRGVLHSDQQLFSNASGSTDAQVRGYTTNPASFLTDFGNAMIKMSSISPLTGSSGQIRTNCRKTN